MDNLDTKFVGLQKVIDEDEIMPISNNRTSKYNNDHKDQINNKLTYRFSLFALVLLILGLIFFHFWKQNSEDKMKREEEFQLMQLYRSESEKEGLCLDGTPFAYYFRQSSSSSSSSSPIKENNNKWIIFLESGTICDSEKSCKELSQTDFGSSKDLSTTLSFGGILSHSAKMNPNFYDYNHVYVKSCDGSTFLSEREEKEKEKEKDNEMLYFRGKKIISSLIKSLNKNHSFNFAKEVILSGCGQSGLSVLILSNYIKSLLPENVTKYKLIVSNGFLIDYLNINDKPVFSEFISSFSQFHNIPNLLNKNCINSHENSTDKCIFPNLLLNYVNTPFFLIQSIFNSYQIGCSLLVDESIPNKCWNIQNWNECSVSLLNPVAQCTNNQKEILNNLGNHTKNILIQTMNNLKNHNGNGYFIHSTPSYCSILSNDWITTTTTTTTTGTSSISSNKYYRLNEIIMRWWISDSNEKSDNHFYLTDLYL